MATSLSRKSLYWTAAGVIVAFAGVIAPIVFASCSSGERGGSQVQSGTGNQQAQHGGLNAGRDIVIQSDEFKRNVHGQTREQALAAAEKYQSVDPDEGKPAPYLIIDAPRHVWVRSSATATGYHIGAVFNEAIVWADCSGTSEFDPVLTDETGGSWLRIRWHTDQPNDHIASSQPSGRYAGWVYAGLTLPAGHNGRIPQCGRL
ncbi:hypothetical protein V1634_29535 [Plantactinospora veratri]|uniref:Uncharacterized protein n=1 Tax=Plantactinospora veratri TaxID=1436122 RepID=A0ABU7SM24_9ACTN